MILVFDAQRVVYLNVLFLRVKVTVYNCPTIKHMYGTQ